MQRITVPQILQEFDITSEYVTCIECYYEDYDTIKAAVITIAKGLGKPFAFLKAVENKFGALYSTEDGYMMDIDV
jgi:hypothetical protein